MSASNDHPIYTMKTPQQMPEETPSNEESHLSRRGFLRGAGAFGLGAGALALGAGGLLAGCGGGGNGGGIATPTPGATTSPTSGTPFTMFISTFLARGVLRYDSSTGTLRELIKLNQRADDDTDTSQNPKFPQTTAGLVVSPNKQNLFIFSPGSDQIFMVDANTGALKKRISSIHGGTVDGANVPNEVAPTNTPHDGIIGPDGKLYYVNAPSLTTRKAPDSIEMLDPSTGEHLGTFVDSTQSPQLRGPFGINFGPDGNVYVSSVLSFGFNPNTIPFRPDKTARFNGKTGAFINFPVQAEHLAFTMAFHPTNGELLAPSFFFNRIYEYNIAQGKLLDAFANVEYPLQVLYGPDGDMFVTSFSDKEHVALLTDVIAANDTAAQGKGRVLRLDGKTGKLKGEVLTNLPYGGFLAFL